MAIEKDFRVKNGLIVGEGATIDGNVGIGTTTPATILDVNSVNPTLTLRDSRTNNSWVAGTALGKIDFYTSDTTFTGAHSIASISVVAGGGNTASPDGVLVFSTGPYVTPAIERMRITSAGNVGIGTSAPLATLSVVGATGAARVQATFSDNLNATFRIATPSNGVVSLGGNTNHNITFGGFANDSSSFTEWARIDTAGNVGIGTTAPTQKLEVTGSAILDANDASLFIKSGATGTKGGINWTFNTDGSIYAFAGIEYDTRSSKGFQIDSGYPITLDATTSGEKSIGFEVSGSEIARFDGNGRFLVGYTSSTDDGAKIQSNGALLIGGALTTGQTNRAALQYSSNETSIRSYGATANSGFITFRTGGGGSDTEKVRIAASGNVGIGTTTPAAKLQVEEVGIETTTTAITTTAETIVYSYPAATFRTAELMCQIVDSTNSQYHSTKFMVIHNSTDVWFNQTSVIHSHDELGTFTVNISGGNVRLLFTPVAATTKSVKVAATMLTS
jgi:hypothetical protein